MKNRGTWGPCRALHYWDTVFPLSSFCFLCIHAELHAVWAYAVQPPPHLSERLVTFIIKVPAVWSHSPISIIRKTAGGRGVLCEREQVCFLTLRHKELLCGLLRGALVFRLMCLQGGTTEFTVIINKHGWETNVYLSWVDVGRKGCL